MLDHAEHDRKQDKEQGNTSRRPVYCRIFRERLHAVRHDIRVKCICHHVSKRCDNNKTEQPAEAEEELPSRFSDILLDQEPHGLSVILDTRIQSSKVRDRSEENASQDDPQKDRQPAERRRLDRSGDRARACDG